MHPQCSSLQCHLEIHYTLYRVHNVCTLLFYSQMHFFNLLIDLTNTLIFIGDIKLVFPFYLYSSFFLQRNEAGNSTGMEFMAFQHCMDFLLAYGLLITTFISDRHSTIASHMKNVLTNIVHYFDIWHLKKSKDIPVFTRSWTGHLSQNTVQSLKYFCNWLSHLRFTSKSDFHVSASQSEDYSEINK